MNVKGSLISGFHLPIGVQIIDTHTPLGFWGSKLKWSSLHKHFTHRATLHLQLIVANLCGARGGSEFVSQMLVFKHSTNRLIPVSP